MNFNLYINDALGEKVTALGTILHKSRNAIITEAILEYLKNHQSWSDKFLDFKGINTLEPFENSRDELLFEPEKDLF